MREPIVWLVAVFVFLVLELISMGLTTIWFAGGAVVAFVASLFGVPIPVQILLFIVTSVVMLIFTRPVVEKKLNNSRTKTNVEEIIGKEGKVTEAVDNFNQKGVVVINGLEWSARNGETDDIIPVGAKVIVKEVQGVKVMVTVI
ncbi:MAG: NfeD family protein [Lachnospiraceae bacterium]|nr:NfeD family protein [Lachnospiraceae bacterium]